MNRDNDKGKILIQRSLYLFGAMVISLLIIILRIYYLQIFQADKYTSLANDNRITTTILVPPRGIIYDKNGVVLAHNTQNFQALIIPEQTKSVKETLKTFSQYVELSEDELIKINKEIKRKRSFVPVKIKEGLNWDQISKILLNSTQMPGIIINDGLSRAYPFAQSMAHLLGYVGAVSDTEKRNNPLLNIPGFQVGKVGIEKIFEEQLRGSGGNLKLEVNAVGRVMKEIERTEGIPGKDLHLTIDAQLQNKTYELLKNHSAAAIVTDVNTGEILSFVSTPAYDPNKISQGINNQEWQELLENPKKPLTNKAISGQYSPGSTFKMITGIAGLESGNTTPNKTVFCSGKMMVGNHTFHCWKDEGHGHTNIVEALEHSCDVYFYDLALKTGINKIFEVAERFGLGKSTNSGFASEKKGLVPNTSWKLKRFNQRWQGGESVIAGIGQGYILSTPIQLAMMTARMVNGGYYVNPSFVKLTDEQKANIKKISVSKNHLLQMKKGMYAVVNKKDGTAFGSRFNINGKKMGGKTGTTQVRRISLKERQTGVLKQEDLAWRLRNHALFVGYAPEDNPKYAVSVIIEHGGSGSGAAAPIASKILQEALKIEKQTKEEK